MNIMVEAQSKKLNPLLTVPVKYALVGSLLTVVLFFILLFFDKNPLIANRWFDFMLLPIFIFFSVKEYKKYYNSGFLHFWQGMTVGFFTCFFIAVIAAAFIWSYLSFASPELLQEFIIDRTNLITESKENFIEQFGEEVYRKTLADMKLVTPADMAWDDFLRKVFIGLFITSIVAVVMRRLPPIEKR